MHSWHTTASNVFDHTSYIFWNGFIPINHYFLITKIPNLLSLVVLAQVWLFPYIYITKPDETGPLSLYDRITITGSKTRCYTTYIPSPPQRDHPSMGRTPNQHPTITHTCYPTLIKMTARHPFFQFLWADLQHNRWIRPFKTISISSLKCLAFLWIFYHILHLFLCMFSDCLYMTIVLNSCLWWCRLVKRRTRICGLSLSPLCSNYPKLWSTSSWRASECMRARITSLAFFRQNWTHVSTSQSQPYFTVPRLDSQPLWETINKPQEKQQQILQRSTSRKTPLQLVSLSQDTTSLSPQREE